MTRWSGPEPSSWLASKPCSRAMRRTIGETTGDRRDGSRPDGAGEGAGRPPRPPATDRRRPNRAGASEARVVAADARVPYPISTAPDSSAAASVGAATPGSGGRGRRRERHEHASRVQHLADLTAERLDDARERRRQLHHRLRRLEFHHGLVGGHLVAGSDEPRDDLGLGQALAEVGQDEVAAHQSHSQVSSAASTRSGVGRWCSSSFGDG